MAPLSAAQRQSQQPVPPDLIDASKLPRHCKCVCCRPDSRRWRPFQQLSGGQQALLSAALAFALQATRPLPLYYFDEVRVMSDVSAAHSTPQQCVAESFRQLEMSEY